MESNATPFSFMPLRSDGSLSCILQQTLSHSTSHPPAALFSSSHGTSLDSTNVTLYYKCEPRIPQTPVPQFPGLKTRIHPGNFQESLSSQFSCITSTHSTPDIYSSMEREDQKIEHKKRVHRKSPHSFGHRTSQYRGVTRHRWTGRWEAHLWDNSCKKEGQARKGRQVYLGGYDNEKKAARAYDLAALKYWGKSAYTNFPLESYCKELEEMANMSRQEHVAHLRRKSSGFSRGASMYRGVTRHHQHGRWQARIGCVSGNKDLYLGTFSTQEEAAKAYDLAAIGFRGANAVTNFDISQYNVAKITADTGVPTQRKHDGAGEEQRSGGNSNNLDSRAGVASDWKPVGQAHMINDAMDDMNGQNPAGQLNDLISIASEGTLDPLYSLGRSSRDCLPVFASLDDPTGQQFM